MNDLKQPTRAALDCQIQQFMVHTLNQRFGSFQSNQGLKFFPRLPSSTPINRSRFHVRGEEKIERKVGQNPTFPAQFSCNCSFLFFLSLSWPSATTTLITGLPTIISTTRSHQTISRGGCTASLSPLQNFSSLPP